MTPFKRTILNPTHSTWFDNVTVGEDCDLYASRLLFVLTYSKCVHDATLCSLEEFVNDNNFSIDYIVQLGETGLKEKIVHLGLGNKNASDFLHYLQALNSS